MKNKKTITMVIVVVAMIAIAVLTIPKLLIGNSYGLSESGSLYENISEFDFASSGEMDGLTKSFLNCVKYEITNIDKQAMMATVDINVPVISDGLSEILDKVIAENNDSDYEELKEIAEKELSNLLESNQIEYEKTTITLMIEKVDGDYKLIPTDEWNQILVKNLEELYMDYLKLLMGGMTDEMPK